MRMGRTLAMPMMAIILGLSMMVGAVSVMRLSNVVENVNRSSCRYGERIRALRLHQMATCQIIKLVRCCPHLKVRHADNLPTSEALDAGAIIVEFTKVGIARLILQ